MTSSHERLADLADVLLSVARVLQHPPVDGLEPLTMTETALMRYIDRNPGTTASAAAAAAMLQRSNASTAIRGLVEKGLVDRTVDDRDARAARLHPTHLATANLAKLRAAWSAMIADAVGDDPRLGDAIALLERLEAGLDAQR